MNDLAVILRDFTPGAYGIWTGVLMFAGWWLKEWRETRKLSSADRQARREGYEKQVQLLMAENRELGADLAKMRDDHELYRKECHRENDQLRRMLVRVEDRIAGYKRQIATLQIWLARHLGELGIPQELIDRATAALNLVDEADDHSPPKN